MTHWSNRLGDISEERFQGALDHVGLGRLLAVTPVTNGMFGQNVFLTSTAGEFVFRGCPHDALQLPRERWAAGAITAQTRLPAPWPYRIAGETALFGWEWAIMPRLPSVVPVDARSPAERLLTAPAGFEGLSTPAALGQALAELHRCAWPRCGSYCPASDGPQPDALGWYDGIVQGLRSELGLHARSRPAVTSADWDWIDDVAAAARDAVAVPFTPTLVHHDFREENVAWLPQDGGWRVSGVFDLAEARVGDGDSDLVRSFLNYARSGSREGLSAAREFLQAYTTDRPLRPGAVERYRFYAVADGLLSGPPWDRSLSLRAWMEPRLQEEWFGTCLGAIAPGTAPD
jgi:hygromycin-B 7''-O-kinase